MDDIADDHEAIDEELAQFSDPADYFKSRWDDGIDLSFPPISRPTPVLQFEGIPQLLNGLPMSGPTKITSTATVCGLCQFHTQHMLMSGEHPIYEHFCHEPRSMAVAKGHPPIFGEIHGREIGRTDNTPDWCPLLPQNQDAPTESTPHSPTPETQGHTPGPWRVERQRRRHWAILCESSLLDDERHTEIIAEINDPVGYMTAEENSANADFIVRAVNAHDDLLAAAKRLVLLMDEVDPNSDLGDEADRVFPHYEFNELRAAISKAEGQSK